MCIVIIIHYLICIVIINVILKKISPVTISYKCSLYCGGRSAAENHTWKSLTLGSILNVVKHYEVGKTTKMCRSINFGESTKRNIRDIAEEIKSSLKAKNM